jgi:hypothetical protein
MTPKKQVSPVIRISQGERDASARATHLEAATRKFLVTTNERKQMSTKTNFKRVALVAVAALGLGVLSSVPSQATIIGTPTVTVSNGTATTVNSDSVGAATVAVRFFTDAGSGVDTAVIRFTGGSSTGAAFAVTDLRMTALDTSLASGAATTLRGNGGNSVTTTPAADLDTAVVWGTAGGFGLDSSTAQAGHGIVSPGGAGNAYGKFGVWLDTMFTRTVGVYSIDYTVRMFEAGVEVTTKAQAGTVTITVTNPSTAAAGTVTAAGTSSAVFYGGTGTFAVNNTIDSTSVSAVNTPDATADAVIRVTQKTSTGAPARESITVTTTIGNIGVNGAAASGKSLVIQADTDGIDDLQIYADGTSGTAVITVKTTSVTFANKSITFYGTSVATITTSQLLTTIGSGTAQNTLVAVPKDAAGNVIRADNAVYSFSDALTVINTGATTGTSCGNYDSVVGGYICAYTGINNGTANITIRNASTVAAATVAATAVAVKVNTAPAAKFTLAFNKATYAPGEKAYIIVKPLDAAGAAVGGGTFTNLFAEGGISSTLAFGSGSETTTAVTLAAAGTTATAGVASTEAVKLYTVYMPVNGGTITISATGGTLLPAAGQVEVKATATVTNDAAAALAAVTALATTVASLRTLITTLTNLVLKIQKKVKA